MSFGTLQLVRPSEAFHSPSPGPGTISNDEYCELCCYVNVSVAFPIQYPLSITMDATYLLILILILDHQAHDSCSDDRFVFDWVEAAGRVDDLASGPDELERPLENLQLHRMELQG